MRRTLGAHPSALPPPYTHPPLTSLHLPAPPIPLQDLELGATPLHAPSSPDMELHPGEPDEKCGVG